MQSSSVNHVAKNWDFTVIVFFIFLYNISGCVKKCSSLSVNTQKYFQMTTQMIVIIINHRKEILQYLCLLRLSTAQFTWSQSYVNYEKQFTRRKCWFFILFLCQMIHSSCEGETYLSKMHCTSKLSTSHTSIFSSWEKRKVRKFDIKCLQKFRIQINNIFLHVIIISRINFLTLQIII